MTLGALGSFATVYLPDDTPLGELVTHLLGMPGIDYVFQNEEGCHRLALPPDRMGDLILIAARDPVIGTTASRHDLSGLDVPLRSHGGITEQRVPMIVSRALRDFDHSRALHNYDAFDLALNHT